MGFRPRRRCRCELPPKRRKEYTETVLLARRRNLLFGTFVVALILLFAWSDPGQPNTGTVKTVVGALAAGILIPLIYVSGISSMFSDHHRPSLSWKCPRCSGHPGSPPHSWLWYRSAYDLLPRVALEDPEKFWGVYGSDENLGLAWFKELCELEGLSSGQPAEFPRFLTGAFPDGGEYLVVEYPKPPALPLRIESGRRSAPCTPGPYYSVFTRATVERDAACFALGQSLEGSGTTLRRCTRGAHYNLGEGPVAELSALVSSIPEAFRRDVRGQSVPHPELLDAVDEELTSEVQGWSLEEFHHRALRERMDEL